MTRPATISRRQVDVPPMFGGLSERRTMTDAVYEQFKTAIVELVRLISEFETVLFEGVQNRRIRAILANLAAHLTGIGLLTAGIPGRNAASVREHAQIYEAIERGDPEAAERFMRRQIRSVRDDQLRALPGADPGGRPPKTPPPDPGTEQ